MQVDMKVETREAVGKGVARTLRQQGKIPAVLYGQGECIGLTIDPAEIRKVLHSESGSNTLLNLSIEKGDKEMKRTAMLRDYQLDPVTGAILHADLFEIALDKPIRVRVPVAVTDGTPVGVAEGGILQHNMRELHVECLPGQIPAHIVVDPTSLKINQGIHVKEVPIPPGVRILDDPDMMVVSVAAPISEAKLEALLATTPAGETAAEPELIGKAKEEEVTEEAAAAGEKAGEKAVEKAGAKAGEKAGAKAGEKAGAKAAAVPAAEAKEEKKEGKEAKDTKGEKKK
jgi:large subunit ribosomal protein L25